MGGCNPKLAVPEAVAQPEINCQFNQCGATHFGGFDGFLDAPYGTINSPKIACIQDTNDCYGMDPEGRYQSCQIKADVHNKILSMGLDETFHQLEGNVHVDAFAPCNYNSKPELIIAGRDKGRYGIYAYDAEKGSLKYPLPVPVESDCTGLQMVGKYLVHSTPAKSDNGVDYQRIIFHETIVNSKGTAPECVPAKTEFVYENRFPVAGWKIVEGPSNRYVFLAMEKFNGKYNKITASEIPLNECFDKPCDPQLKPKDAWFAEPTGESITWTIVSNKDEKSGKSNNVCVTFGYESGICEAYDVFLTEGKE